MHQQVQNGVYLELRERYSYILGHFYLELGEASYTHVHLPPLLSDDPIPIPTRSLPYPKSLLYYLICAFFYESSHYDFFQNKNHHPS